MSDNTRIQTPPFPFMEEEYVSALMNRDSNSWDEEAIRNIFNQRDANLILSNPLPIIKRPDTLIWNREEKGVFTVKSCYKVLTGELNTNEVKEWSCVWKLHLPPKVKQFF